MIDKIADGLNKSGAAEIATHLARVDDSFEPSLSSRIDIQAYAQRLRDHAVRFETWRGEELIGLVAIYCNRPDKGKAFVTNVSVLPQCQGCGIAKLLMRRSIKYVRALGFRRLELEVDQRNLPAVWLYQKLGLITLRSNGSTLIMGMALGDHPI